MSIQQVAGEYTRHGLTVIPTGRYDRNGNYSLKFPRGLDGHGGGWTKPPFDKPLTSELITRLFPVDDPTVGIGVMCGTPSGNLVAVEIEGRAMNRVGEIQQAFTTAGRLDLWDTLNKGWVEQSRSGGIHWFYRTDPLPTRSLKLALEPTGNGPDECLTEALSTGRQVVIAPTSGESGTWITINGGPTTIPTLTSEDSELVLDCFAALDLRQHREPQPAPVLPMPHPTTPHTGRLRPGDDYAQKTPWSDILTPQGWTVHSQTSTETHWTRPGKETRDGMSATTRPDGNLYIFSTSTDLPTEQPLSKLYVYAHYHHGGDLSAAAKQLASEGYGESLADVVIDLPKAPTTMPADAGNGVDGQLATVIDIEDHPRVSHSGQLHEAANGKYLVDAYGDRIRYITDRDRWLHWNGHTWETTGRGAAPIKQLAVTALEALPAITKEEQRFRLKSLGSAGISNTLTLAATDPRIAIQQSDLDSHPGELNTPGGIVNLHTGQLLPSDPAKLHTRSTLITPDWHMPTPRWNTFLEETFTGHQGLDTYVQQLAGYAATGYVRTQILPFLYGAGANGKSVLADVLMRLLADYAEPAPANFLMMTQTQHPTEIARLQGARMVVASEVPEGGKFDEVKVKQLTGGDTLTARYMHGDFFTFQPTHKLWLLGNHQPKVSAGGYSFWRRLRQIPFTNIVPENKRDLALADKLINQEGPGILAWIINGAVNYLAHGLNEPTEVLAATKEYEAGEDQLGRFVEDRLILGGGSTNRVPYKTMRHEYTAWCKLEGVNASSARTFTQELQMRWNIDSVKSNGARFYTNVTLLNDADEPEEDPRPNSPQDLGFGGF